MAILPRVLTLAAVGIGLLAAIEREPWDVYQSRRRALAEKHADGIILLFGYGEQEAQPSRSPFRQENNFYYLTGWNEPDAVLLLLPAGGNRARHRAVLFLPARNPSEEIWEGPRTGPSDLDLAAKTGFSEVRSLSTLGEAVLQALKSYKGVYTLLPHAVSYGQQREPDRGARLEELASGYPKMDIRPSISSMRMVKSEREIHFIQKAVEATVAGHLAAWKKIYPGLHEYQVTAAMIGPMMDRGCFRLAYPPIVGSGGNSTILHYSRNSKQLGPGELLLMDVGGEYAHYAADVTRTVPVDGKFRERQREVYNLVLGAQEATIAAVKPGMTLAGSGPQSLNRIALEYFNSHGRDSNGRSVGRYFLHAVGHHVGLEVQDPGNPHTPLQPGMVIAIEPGLYLKEKKIGVRIEDMVLVTANGARVLSSALPREADEIERIMSSRPLPATR